MIIDVVINSMVGDAGYLADDIFTLYFSVGLMICILDWSKQKFKSYKIGISLLIVWQVTVFCIIAFVLSSMLPHWGYLLIQTFLGCVAGQANTSIFAILGVILYYCRNNRRKFIVTYTILSLLPSFLSFTGFFARLFAHLSIYESNITLTIIIEGLNILVQMIGLDTFYIREISVSTLMTFDFQWIMIAALPIILMYNGKRGKGYKYFFYLYYPVHIVTLVFIRFYFWGL